VLSDLDIAECCLALYGDPPTGKWDWVWPTRIGFAGKFSDGGVEYLIHRGSQDPADWWVDLDAVPVDWPPLGYVHRGMLGDVLWTEKQIADGLGARTVMAGHSLGGGLAVLRGALLRALGRPPEAVVIFEPPRVAFRSLLSGVVSAGTRPVPVRAYQNETDVVTSVPPYPYVDETAFTHLSVGAAPGDDTLFRFHHLPLVIEGLKLLKGATT
jgi:hypothetical protein